jgi:GntR family transcriptional regulator
MGKNSRPLYAQTAELVEKYIESRGLVRGDRLPRESTLADELGVSRSTIREALRELELQGRIERVQGRGTMVVEPPAITTGLTTLESLESLARRQGWRCGTEKVIIEEVPMPERFAHVLEVSIPSASVYLSRIKTRDWRPICRMETWIPTRLMSAEELRRSFEGSITELLLNREGARVDYAVAEVDAATADPDTAAALNVSVGGPLTVLKEIFYQHPATPLCYCVNSFLPESVRLEVLRRPSSVL